MRHLNCALLLLVLLIPLGAFAQMDSVTAYHRCGGRLNAPEFELVEILMEKPTDTVMGIVPMHIGIGTNSQEDTKKTSKMDSLKMEHDTFFFARIFTEEYFKRLSLLRRFKIKILFDCHNGERLYEAGLLNDLVYCHDSDFKGKDIVFEKLRTVVHAYGRLEEMPYYIRNSKSITYLLIDYAAKPKKLYKFLPEKLKYLSIDINGDIKSRLFVPSSVFALPDIRILKIETVGSYHKDMVIENENIPTSCSLEAFRSFNLDISNPKNQKILLNFKKLKHLAAKISKPIDLDVFVEKHQLTSLHIYIIDKKIYDEFLLKYKGNARIKIYSDSNFPWGLSFFCGGEGQFYGNPF